MSGSHTWTEHFEGLPFHASARDAPVHPWRPRGLELHSRDAEHPFRRVPEPELQRRLNSKAHLIEAAAPHLAALLKRTGGATTVAYVTDEDGIVLHSVGAPEQIRTFHLEPGYDWSEATMGKNGAGTALASGAAVAVIGDEHFYHAFQNCTCTASPIFGPGWTLIGAIDVSSSVAEAKPERLSDVIQCALDIEADHHWRCRCH